jgi:hypothetical protein
MIRGSELHDLVGNESVLCILKTYLLLQIKKIEPARLNFSELNVPSSGLVLSSLMVEFNLSSFCLVDEFNPLHYKTTLQILRCLIDVAVPLPN